jgi:transposase-like protein
MADEVADSPQRWTAKRRAALVVSLLKGETSAAEAARKHGLTVAQVEEWRELFLTGAEALKEQQIRRLKEKVGDLVMDLEILEEATRGRPFARTTSDE